MSIFDFESPLGVTKCSCALSLLLFYLKSLFAVWDIISINYLFPLIVGVYKKLLYMLCGKVLFLVSGFQIPEENLLLWK